MITREQRLIADMRALVSEGRKPGWDSKALNLLLTYCDERHRARETSTERLIDVLSQLFDKEQRYESARKWFQ